MKRKLKLRFDRDFFVLFSNYTTGDENGFHVAMVYHKSMKGGFDHPITIEKCNKLLKKIDPKYYYVDQESTNIQI